MIDTSNDPRLQEWIQRDLAENMALVEFCDVDDAIVSPPKTPNILLPKFRIEGKTKKGQTTKKKKVFEIPESKIQELKDMMDQIELINQDIEKEKKKITVIQGSNAQLHRDVLETKQRLNQVKTEVEDTKLAQLKKLEETRVIQEKVKKEENRSRKARSAISQKKITAEEELKNLTDEFANLELKYKAFKQKRKKEKKTLEDKILSNKAENAKLKEKLSLIEIRLAQNE